MSRAEKRAIVVLIGLAAVAISGLALARHETFHNQTYDLAIYARIAWGLAHLDAWEPILGASALGLHLSPILIPLGWFGAIFGTVPVLLSAQGLAVALAAWPIALVGERRLGRFGALFAALLWLLQPNLWHVATYEFHPGTLAILPLAWAVEGIDRQDARTLTLATLGVLSCREDLALITLLLALVAYLEGGPLRRASARVAMLSLGWLLLFFAILHPLFRPTRGSLEAHFGVWGDGVSDILRAWLTRPLDVWAHLTLPRRLSYLPRVLLTFGWLPLLAPRWLLATLPIFAVNLLSAFPTTTNLDSHYLTPALPLLAVAAITGLSRVRGWTRTMPARRPLLGAYAIGILCLIFFTELASPLTPDARAFLHDDRGQSARVALEAIPAAASVQAPDSLLPHLAERHILHRAPPPERETDFVILDIWHRDRWAREETLLRTSEEPLVRRWLARSDHGLVTAAPPFLVLARGADPRAGVASRYLAGRAALSTTDRALTACLAIRAARRVEADLVELELVARGACPADLALRVDRHVDLLFDGLLSPAHLRAGDRLRSTHRVDVGRDEIAIGTLRSSGAPAVKGDPRSLSVPIRER